jgi:hypothetical protein
MNKMVIGNIMQEGIFQGIPQLASLPIVFAASFYLRSIYKELQKQISESEKRMRGPKPDQKHFSDSIYDCLYKDITKLINFNESFGFLVALIIIFRFIFAFNYIGPIFLVIDIIILFYFFSMAWTQIHIIKTSQVFFDE